MSMSIIKPCLLHQALSSYARAKTLRQPRSQALSSMRRRGTWRGFVLSCDFMYTSHVWQENIAYYYHVRLLEITQCLAHWFFYTFFYQFKRFKALVLEESIIIPILDLAEIVQPRQRNVKKTHMLTRNPVLTSVVSEFAFIYI